MGRLADDEGLRTSIRWALRPLAQPGASRLPALFAGLLPLLPTYGSWHFREEVRDGMLTFDYHLRHGACSTRNALAILEVAGYPESVVAAARQTASSLEQRVRGNSTEG